MAKHSGALPAAHDPITATRIAGLRHVDDSMPGIRRRPAGSGFRYLGPDGESIHDEATLARIKTLAIPPAWTDVWICPWDNGHIQATGRDAKGRKQYRYHARWRDVRVGNEEYARHNKSFGLTTLRDRLARIIRRVRDLPGQELFQYVDDDGQVHSVGSADVNDYPRTLTGEAYSAKDFRAWAGTLLAVLALLERRLLEQAPEPPRQKKRPSAKDSKARRR